MEAVGLILPPAHAKRLHQRDVITYPHQVAEVDFTGTPPLALAALLAQAHLERLLAEGQAAALVLQDITGCLIVADGACLTVQLEVALRQLPHQPQPNQQRHHQLLPNLVLQVNRHQLAAPNKT